MTHAEANTRAAEAERAVVGRFIGHAPGFAWGRSAWPPHRRGERRGGGAGWHYWWQAHLVDAAVDAARHRPSTAGAGRVRALVRGTWLRNGARWSRPFWDDLAWLGLALERDERARSPRLARHAADRIAARLEAAIDPAVGAVPWQVGDRLYNAPANGPASILLARTGRSDAAERLADWIDATLRDAASGLVNDGVVLDGSGARTVTDLYTYCQGVSVAADAELFRLTGGDRFAERAASLIDAITAWAGPDGVLPGRGAGDGGLFAGITVRHLAAAADALDAGPAHRDAARAAASARALVLRNAEAIWQTRDTSLGAPLFSEDWRRAASPAPDAAERDLSVQLGAWLALEAAVDADA